MIWTFAYTGLRWGELVALRVRDFDAAKARFTVNENAVYVNSGYVLDTPKNHRVRDVPVPEFLCVKVSEQIRGRRSTDLIFGDGENYVNQPSSVSGWFISAVRACQESDPTFPTVTPHDLRHTAASLAISAGSNVKAVQRMLGHSSAAVTLDTYADLFDDDLDAVALTLNAARASRIVSTGVSTSDFRGK